jgi:shikimate dehydrogenase
MKIFGLIGEKLSHSFSPAIHQQIYQKLGIDAAYHLFEVQPPLLAAAIEGLRALNINGVNITIPYKIHTMEHLDQISPEAAAIGSVNTILNDQGFLTGYNTDYFGFQKTLAHYGIPVKGKRIMVLGSGGASRAVVAALRSCDVSEILMLARDPQRVTGFEGRVCRILPYEQISDGGHCALLVNCTPVGMYPNRESSPLPKSQLPQFDCVLDLIYNPAATKLMKEAAQLGIPAYNGLYMLAAQAAAAIELWNGLSLEDGMLQDTYLYLQHVVK